MAYLAEDAAVDGGEPQHIDYDDELFDGMEDEDQIIQSMGFATPRQTS